MPWAFSESAARAILDGRLSLGILVAFSGYVAYLAWPTMALGWVLAIVPGGWRRSGRVMEILDTPPPDRRRARGDPPATPCGARSRFAG